MLGHALPDYAAAGSAWAPASVLPRSTAWSIVPTM
jgi:hypothetical protein